MDVGVYPYPHGDPLLIDKIVNEFLSQGKFDKLRKECMSDADTKPAYQNLQQRVENTVTQFLKKQVWRPDLNKNQLRDSLRKHILESGFFDAGINRIVDQVVNPNVLATVFMPEVEEVVYNYLSIPRPADRNPRKVYSVDEKAKQGGNENEHKFSQENGKYDSSGRERIDSSGGQTTDQTENHKPKVDRLALKDLDAFMGTPETLTPTEEKTKKTETVIKVEEKIKWEPEEGSKYVNQSRNEEVKMEVPSDESEESLSRMGVECLQINEPEIPVPDSDDSVPLEINEKSMSESRDSEDSIMNQMSPISQGRLTPEIEDEKPEKGEGEEKQEKEEEKKSGREEEIKPVREEEKKPLTFIGRIPKIKREDSESSKSSKAEATKKEKLEVKNIYSSDESDSSKSYGKSDSDERKSREKKKSEEALSKDGERKHGRDERKKHDDSRKRSKDRKREKSRERHGSKKSSRERSSSRHKSSHQSRHRDSKSRDQDKKKKEEEKKKSKNTDDHGKERNKKEDRRSTDRDSNERERDRSTGSRSQGESRKREKEQKTGTEGKETEKKEEAQEEEEAMPGDEGEVVIEMEGEWVPGEEVLVVKVEEVGRVSPSEECADWGELRQSGAITKMDFPKLTDDFYVKFNSTGFRYFEEWEKNKLDCEEEFKEFVDEACTNLSLISDDESDLEGGIDFDFEEENRKTIANLLKGLGNFRKSLMYDPQTCEFYRWTNNKLYQKHRKGGADRAERTESDDSIKENIDGEKENQRKDKALHLKLLNKYRRKAMRQGKPKRRHRRVRDSFGGIKEKNDNSSGVVYKTESDGWRLSKITNFNLVDGSVGEISEATVTTLPNSPEDNDCEWTNQKNLIQIDAPKSETKVSATNISQSLPLNLPPSPDSDDVHSNKTALKTSTSRKRGLKSEEGGTPKKQSRRNYSQKYDNQDLYKPRPVLNGSRTRGRERGPETGIVNVGERLGPPPH